MGLFDRLADHMFEKDQEGRDIFLPFGMLAKGRLIEDKDDFRRFRTMTKWTQIGFFVFLIAAVAIDLGGWEWLAFFAFVVVAQILQLKTASRFPISDHPSPGFMRSVQKLSVLVGGAVLWGTLVFNVVIAGLFTVGIVGPALEPEQYEPVTWDIVAVVVLLWCGVPLWWWLIRLRKRTLASPAPPIGRDENPDL